MAGQLSQQDKRQLKRFIRSGSNSFELLYSFTNDGANAETFHEKCDNKGPTLTVIYNTQGSVYGGYTEQSWCQANRHKRLDPHAFLYRLKLNYKAAPMKFPVKFKEEAILCDKEFGPTFGERDLCTFYGTCIANDNVFTLNGSTNFGQSYDMKDVSEITNNIVTVRNLEVYSVTDRNYGLMEEPWRKFDFWELNELHALKGKEKIEKYSPPRGIDINVANILFLGPVGAGKSSFFNSISSVLTGRMTKQAVAGPDEQSITSKYSWYTIKEDKGLELSELEKLLDGHVPNGYQFNPSGPISTDIQGSIRSQEKSDKINCVCFIFDGSTVADMPENLLKKIDEFQSKIRNKLLFQQVILLTKVDKVCSYVEKDVKAVFRSEAIHELVKTVSEMFRVEQSYVLLVKNYEKKDDLDDDISILLLWAYRQILQSATD